MIQISDGALLMMLRQDKNLISHWPIIQKIEIGSRFVEEKINAEMPPETTWFVVGLFSVAGPD